MRTEQITLEGESVDPSEPDPKVLSVVSCGQSKQDLDNGETVPARELYTSSIHVCKDRYGRQSHGYYIASAKFGSSITTRNCRITIRRSRRCPPRLFANGLRT